jgi:hypothetical protein
VQWWAVAEEVRRGGRLAGGVLTSSAVRCEWEGERKMGSWFVVVRVESGRNFTRVAVRGQHTAAKDSTKSTVQCGT